MLIGDYIVFRCRLCELLFFFYSVLLVQSYFNSPHFTAHVLFPNSSIIVPFGVSINLANKLSLFY